MSQISGGELMLRCLQQEGASAIFGVLDGSHNAVLMKLDGVGDQYQIIVDREPLDRLHLKVEVAENFFNSSEYNPEAFMRKLGEELTAVMTIRVKIELMDPGSLPRTEGKAKRVIDLRKE